MTDFEARQQSAFDLLVQHRQGEFLTERPAVFGPAAAAQDPANSSGIYFRWSPFMLPYEFTNWYEECRSHVDSCYIGDWSSIGKLVVRGPQALSCLSFIGMNDLSKFEVGQIKHHVQLDERGYVASEGVLYRLGAEEFYYTGGGVDWTEWQCRRGNWDVEIEYLTAKRFIFEVQGPRSIFALEAALGESIRDLAFNRGRPALLGGTPVHLLRTGISGELGYELHGSVNDASTVWRAVVEAGSAFDLRQLGSRSILVQHIEAGIATAGLDYLPASIGTPGAAKVVPEGAMRGSFIPRNGLADYFRYPSELGWGRGGRIPAHDFVGRDALVALKADGGSRRTLVNLEWNAQDLVALFADRFDATKPMPEQMENPRFNGLAFDSVLVGGEEIGVSSSATFSAALRTNISLCVIQNEYAVPGTEVVVLWGTDGGPQRELRARVAKAPIRPDGRKVDVTAL